MGLENIRMVNFLMQQLKGSFTTAQTSRALES